METTRLTSLIQILERKISLKETRENSEYSNEYDAYLKSAKEISVENSCNYCFGHGICAVIHRNNKILMACDCATGQYRGKWLIPQYHDALKKNGINRTKMKSDFITENNFAKQWLILNKQFIEISRNYWSNNLDDLNNNS